MDPSLPFGELWDPSTTRASDRRTAAAWVHRELARRGCDRCGGRSGLLWVRPEGWPWRRRTVWDLVADRLPRVRLQWAMARCTVRCRRCHLAEWSCKLWDRRRQLSVALVGGAGAGATTIGRGAKRVNVLTAKACAIVRQTIEIA